MLQTEGMEDAKRVHLKLQQLRQEDISQPPAVADAELVREGLADLFVWWYGKHHSIVSYVQRDGWRGNAQEAQARELPFAVIDAAWRERWFAKGELTLQVDRMMSERFGWLLDAVQPVNDSLPRWERLARIILFDQVSRNVHRGTPQAYANDAKALPLALDFLINAAVMAVLPFHFQAREMLERCGLYVMG